MGLHVKKNGVDKRVAVIPNGYPASNIKMANGESVEDALNYSTDEHIVGKWIDGSALYEKTLNTGAMPNASTSYIDLGISNLDKIISINGMAYNSAKTVQIPLPLIGNTIEEAIIVYYLNSKIAIISHMDRTSFDTGYLTICYTKRT